MTLLLDTHAFLWFCQGDPALSAAAKTLIENAARRKLVSVASCWEIAIKAGLGKLKLGEPSDTYIPAALTRTGFEILPVAVADRLLVAQALAENIPIVSADPVLDAYAITRLW